MIQQRGRAEAEGEIMVQLPGVDDPARVKQIMQTAAMLEIAEVKDGPFASQEAALAKHGGVLPLNTKLVRMAPRGRIRRELVPADPHGRDHGPGPAQRAPRTGRVPQVGNQLHLDAGRRPAFRPVHRSQHRQPPGGGFGQADPQRGHDSVPHRRFGPHHRAKRADEASDLSLVLRSGSLPAGIVYLEERTVGPSLGADSIRQGVLAGLVGLAMVIAVMLVYYRKSGLNAIIALLLNGVITVAALAYFDAVWTLPGIAGIILSIGMAVDSNVLIFERIREELRAGKAVVAAVAAGFDSAFLTIIDTHVTTVVSCAFLFMFGTGPIKGFAVTLVIGLVANLFTAVFVSRAMFDMVLTRSRQVVRLSI